MPSTSVNTLAEAIEHALTKAGDAHVEVDAKGSPAEQREAIIALIDEWRHAGLRMEIMGSNERLAEAGLLAGKILIPADEEKRWPPVVVHRGAVDRLGGVRVKVQAKGPSA